MAVDALASTAAVERQYHDTSAAYALPNDNVEHQRLEEQHELLTDLMRGTILHAPIGSSLSKALDVGCGTGAATHAIASAFPSAKVYGIDLSPVPTHLRTRLPNLGFVQGDFSKAATSDPRFAPASFDYVFSRLLTYGITDWQSYVDRTASLAKPGAWVEMQEADYQWYRLPPSASQLPPPSTFASHDLSLAELQSKAHPSEKFRTAPYWSVALASLLAAKALNPFAGSRIASYMLKAGLKDIRVRRYISPAGVWPGLTHEAAAFGKYVGKQTPLMYPAAMRKLGSETGRDAREVEEAVKDLQREFASGEGARMWFWMYVVCGRKPPS